MLQLRKHSDTVYKRQQLLSLVLAASWLKLQLTLN